MSTKYVVENWNASGLVAVRRISDDGNDTVWTERNTYNSDNHARTIAFHLNDAYRRGTQER
jgi:hypothetical protein